MKTKTTKTRTVRQVWVRTEQGTFRAGEPTDVRWRADAMVGYLLERDDVLNAWHAAVAA
jgi:hypothetical protein